MTTAKSDTATIDKGLDAIDDAADQASDRASDVLETARSTAERAAARVPEVADRARAGVEDTTSRLQTMPDDTLRLMAAASLGLAAGFFISGAPRVATLAALVPAFLVGGAMATRSS